MSAGTQSGKIDTFIVRTGVLAGLVTFALGLLGASPALAQSCGELAIGQAPKWDALPDFGPGLSGGLAISSAVTAAHTAFLSQGTAFVGAPANPRPDSEGSGIWIRGVGGELTVNSSTSVGASLTAPTPMPGTGTGSTTCSAKFQQTFGGFQLGHDIAKLNVGGWNLTLGTTAGFLETAGHIVGGNVGHIDGLSDAAGRPFNSTTQAPFVGTYAVAAYGNFSIDGLLQYDYFQTSLDSPSINFFNQKIAAHGFTAAASAGYTWQVPNSNWFIEPRAGVVWSRENVDPVNSASPGFRGSIETPLSGTTQINTIESVTGRVGVRAGTTVETTSVMYQPFVAASVWHDFGSRLTANYSTCPNCLANGQETLSANLSTSNIGTFGQYSVGVSGQIKDTGWLGFARFDYRAGSEIRGLSGAGGIRYQFMPTEAASVMPVKETPAWRDYPVNWTGLYVGGFGGAQYGRASMAFPASQTFSGSTADIRPSGWLGGGTLGYNYQVGKWVLGVEGDFAGTNASGSQQCASPAMIGEFAPAVPLFQTACHDNLNWVATATARLGYAWAPRTLLYVKAGGAWADDELSWTCNFGSDNKTVVPSEQCTNSANKVADGASVRNTRAGWTAGFGTEFALTDRWSIKGEFDWLDFGTKSLTLSDGTSVNSSLRTAQGKVGVNYKLFGP